MNRRKTGIAPYWTRFGSFFLYPMQVEHVLACLGLGVLTGLANWLYAPLEILLLIIVGVVTLRYAYRILERTARGYLDDTMVFVDSRHGGQYLPYKQFVVLAIGLTLCAYVARAISPHLAAVVGVLLALMLPANIMILAMTNELSESIKPRQLWAIMHGIGVPYLGLCACLLMLSSSSAFFVHLLAPALPGALLAVLGGFTGTWFTIVMFRLMGYTLYQYHDALDFDIGVDVDFARQPGSIDSTDPAPQRPERIAALLKAGDYAAAIGLAREEVQSDPGNFSARQRLHRLLLAVPGQETAALEHAQEWLRSLLHGRKFVPAVEIAAYVLPRNPDFRIAPIASILPLAQACFEARRFAEAMQLIQRFDQRFPGHADIPAIYVLGARLLIEHQRDEAQAQRVLAAVRRHFPDSQATAEATQLERLLDRLQGVQAATDA
ncbi:MAG: tetratricopeptide repeat protein [Azonexus sp.]